MPATTWRRSRQIRSRKPYRPWWPTIGPCTTPSTNPDDEDEADRADAEPERLEAEAEDLRDREKVRLEKALEVLPFQPYRTQAMNPLFSDLAVRYPAINESLFEAISENRLAPVNGLHTGSGEVKSFEGQQHAGGGYFGGRRIAIRSPRILAPYPMRSPLSYMPITTVFSTSHYSTPGNLSSLSILFFTELVCWKQLQVGLDGVGQIFI